MKHMVYPRDQQVNGYRNHNEVKESSSNNKWSRISTSYTQHQKNII